MARQRDKNSSDNCQVKRIKDGNGKILTKSVDILKRWKIDFKKLANKENTKIVRMILIGKIEGLGQVADKEVANALRKMRRGKAVGERRVI